MSKQKYEIRYLPRAQQDLFEIIDYIATHLQNPQSAKQLIDQIETAIEKRKETPLAFQPFLSTRKRKYLYYRIYVANYIVFYVVIDHTMEIRRILYGGRNLEKLL